MSGIRVEVIAMPGRETIPGARMVCAPMVVGWRLAAHNIGGARRGTRQGFTVVAAEVRKPTERSQIAAQEIGELAGSGVETAERAGTLLPSIRETADLVRDSVIPKRADCQMA